MSKKLVRLDVSTNVRVTGAGHMRRDVLRVKILVEFQVGENMLLGKRHMENIIRTAVRGKMAMFYSQVIW